MIEIDRSDCRGVLAWLDRGPRSRDLPPLVRSEAICHSTQIPIGEICSCCSYFLCLGPAILLLSLLYSIYATSSHQRHPAGHTLMDQEHQTTPSWDSDISDMSLTADRAAVTIRRREVPTELQAHSVDRRPEAHRY